MLSSTISPGNQVRVVLKSAIDTSVFTGSVLAVDAQYALASMVMDLAAYQLAYAAEEANPVELADHNYLIIRDSSGHTYAFAEDWIDTVTVTDPSSTVIITVTDLTETARAKLIRYMVALGISYTISE